MNLKKVTIRFVFTFVTAVALGCMITSCSNDEYEGGDLSCPYHTRSANLTYDYLDISNYSFPNMTFEDFCTFHEAEQRMEVASHTEKLITTNGVGAMELNISDSLYQLVLEVVDNTNNLISFSDKMQQKTFAKRKVQGLPELPDGSAGEDDVPDCVIQAIRYVSGNKKTYAQIKTYCDVNLPNWEKDGGIPTAEIHGIMKNFCGLNYEPVTGDAFRAKCYIVSDTVKFDYKEVAAFVRIGGDSKSREDHCVNLCFLLPDSNGAQFYVYDYQQKKAYKRSIDDLICVFLKP